MRKNIHQTQTHRFDQILWSSSGEKQKLNKMIQVNILKPRMRGHTPLFNGVYNNYVDLVDKTN
jgi:hypothetical protein